MKDLGSPHDSAKVLEYMPLVEATARRIQTQLEYEDRRQAGSLGLLYALKHFDEAKAAAKQTCFAAYATRCIRGYILQATVKSCNQFGLPVAKFWTKHGVSTTSLEVLTEGHAELEDRLSLSPAVYEESSETREQLEQAIATLSAREQRILRLRFGWNGAKGKTLKAVAANLGVSGEYIRQLQKRALEKLKFRVFT